MGNLSLPLIDEVKSHPGANMSDAYRALMRFAINHDLSPARNVVTPNMQRASVFCPPALHAKIQEIANQNDLGLQEAAAGLAHAGAKSMKEAADKSASEAPKVDTLPFPAKPQQAIFYKEIIAGLEQKKITVAEASTGIGKGRALMAAAVHAALQTHTPVIVAAPTVIVVNQLWDELVELRKSYLDANQVSATILPGSTEIADDITLKEWLSDEVESEKDAAVANWIREGGPHTADDPIAQVAQEQGIQLAWLMSDLNKIATNFPVDDFVLRTDKGDKTKGSESRALLAAIREAANRKAFAKNENSSQADDQVVHAGADIILCTHAMLALGQKTNWAVLPKPGVILVDEAHLLEQTISQINSHQISLFAISYRIGRFCRAKNCKKGSVPRNTLAAAKALMKKCQAFSANDARIKLNSDPDQYKSVREEIANLSNMIRSKAFSADTSVQKDLGNLLANAAAMMANGKTPSSTHLQFSPDKRYPSISVGADSIDREAGALWKAAEKGVILASATLYITDEYGEQKCDYVVRNLAIPQSRLHTFVPVVASCIYTLPSLYTPLPSSHALLSRPTDRTDKDANDEWLKNIATQVNTIATNAVGGTLILTSAYAQISGIEKHLLELRPEAEKRLVVQKRGVKFAISVDKFKAMHAEGLRPIWIGLGPAWTGLNLLDETKQNGTNDLLLTDLVIACCPIGLNQSPTMQLRIERTKTNAIAKEALLTFKQGLGRLIRRDDVDHRNIWILDARLWGDSWLTQFTKPAKRLLSQYKIQKFFGHLKGNS